MSEVKIIVPTDFQNPASTALQQAIMLAKRTSGSLALLHIADEDHPEKSEDKMTALCESVLKEHGITCHHMVEHGDIYEDIGRITDRHNATFMVIGTHGLRGLAQHLFGARIIKVLNSVSVPAIVVQDETPVQKDFRKILLPVDDIESFEEKVRSTIPFAQWSGAEVMLYAIAHPMKNEKKLREHIELSRKLLNEANVSFEETEESPTVFSAGIAKQTLNFAKTWGADLIVISLCDTENMANINEADCERILTNDDHTAVLVAPEKLVKQKLFG